MNQHDILRTVGGATSFAPGFMPDVNVHRVHPVFNAV